MGGGPGIGKFVDFAASSEAVVTAVLLAVVPLLVVARWTYSRWYLRRRLFFEPWINLSGDSSLDIGASLAELLFFELESLHALLIRGRDRGGLWNERFALPPFERLFEGLPSFVRHVELLGLPGRVANIVRFVLAVRPPRLHGTIHRFGGTVRFQVMLDGFPRVDPSPGGNTEARKANAGPAGPRTDGAQPRVGWCQELTADDRGAIPEAVKEIAHEIILDLGGVKAFKSAKSFMHYTRGLREHLLFNELHGRTEIGAKAIECYQESIAVQCQNPFASYAIAQILYSSYDCDGNEGAIKQYHEALRTDIQTLRARAFRGLADAYSQRVHRHNRGGDDVIDAALRWADFARELCDASDRASIKKALAFATQIQADRPGVNPDQRERLFEEAMKLYREATECDPEFTVAHNNLGFLHLERAKRNLTALDHAEDGANLSERRKSELRPLIEGDLKQAESCCMTAIRGDPTYHHAYDNLGNIHFEWSRLSSGGAEEALKKAEDCYYKAIAYSPRYNAAYADLARLCLRRIKLRTAPVVSGVDGASERPDHLNRSWDAHWRCLETTADTESKRKRCKDFREDLAKTVPGGLRADWPNGEEARATAAGCQCPTLELPAVLQFRNAEVVNG